MDSILEWINHIRQPRKELGGKSVCPFAKIDSTIFKHNIFSIDNFNVSNDFAINVELSGTSSMERLEEICQALNKKYPDLVFLPDHPSRKSFINGVQTSNNSHPIILMQTRKELEEARDKLKKTDYYSYWDEDYLKEIMNY